MTTTSRSRRCRLGIQQLQGRSVVGVFPKSAYGDRRRLFDALATAFPVDFVPRDSHEHSGLDGAVVLAGGPERAGELASTGVPVLLGGAAQLTDARAAPVRFSSENAVDERLRGRSLLQEGLSASGPRATDRGDVVLATGPTGPLWVARTGEGADVREVFALPTELRNGERLRDQLRSGRFLPLLAMVQFLRELDQSRCRPAGPRATLILDDPNLHWSSYGHVRYPVLADHAVEHGYHVGIAMVPIDAAVAHGPTVRLFRDRPELSLLIHGNDHVKWELARPYTETRALAIAAQSLRRIARFERKNGVSVCRVMVPPHDDCSRPRKVGYHAPPGACSEDMMAALLRTGFEAVCYYGPAGQRSGAALVGWEPADVHVGGGLPGLHRLPFDASLDDIVLQAFLDQPVILFGHHADTHDLRVLAEAAARVNQLSGVKWSSTTDIARSNFSTRQEGTTLHVRSFSRRIKLSVPEGIEHVVVELAGQHPVGASVLTGSSAAGATSMWGEGDPVPVAGPATLDVAVVAPRSVDPDAVPSLSWRPWPLLRRCLTEGRDRLSPVLRH